jgi:hypothetical protein
MKLLIILFTLFLTGCMSEQQKFEQRYLKCMEKYEKLTGSEFYHKNYINVAMLCQQKSEK